MDRRLFLLSALALGACATPPQPAAQQPSAPQPPGFYGELEPVFAAVARRDALAISVSSNGCTKREDFAFFVERKGQAVSIAFARKRLDPCKSFAMGKTELAFTWEELGLARGTPMFLLNPLLGWTGPGL